jgi:Zn-dependent protease
LDGGRVMAGILPLDLARRYARLERYGFLVLFLLLWTGAIGVVIDPIIEVIARMLL